jgi:hypothetical protein
MTSSKIYHSNANGNDLSQILHSLTLYPSSYLENTTMRAGIKNFYSLQFSIRKITPNKGRFYGTDFAKASLGKIAIDEHTLLNTPSIPVNFAQYSGHFLKRDAIAIQQRSEKSECNLNQK